MLLMILLMLLIFCDAGRWRTHILRISPSAPIVCVGIVRVSLVARVWIAWVWFAIAAILRIVRLLSGWLIGVLGRVVWSVGMGILRLGLDVSSWLSVVSVRWWGEIVAGWVLLPSLLVRIVVVRIRTVHRWCAVVVVASVIVVVIIIAACFPKVSNILTVS